MNTIPCHISQFLKSVDISNPSGAIEQYRKSWNLLEDQKDNVAALTIKNVKYDNTIYAGCDHLTQSKIVITSLSYS
ncbi:hypothetical protein G9A89_014317 [Geosiphon pyriformis]|nr:hypothetical protein G9A89_014317 [Geosiphon pyriformis]